MFAFIARQPILTKTQDLFAYELLFRDGNNGCYPEHDPQRAQTISRRFNTLSIDDISGDQKSFINFLPDTLIHRFPNDLSAEKVTIEITQNPQSSTELMAACKHIKSMGFQIALKQNMPSAVLSLPLELVDIIKLDTDTMNIGVMDKIIQQSQASQTTLVAENVDSLEQFTNLCDLGFDLFQGYFFTQRSTKEVQSLPASTLTLLELMSQCTQAIFDLRKVNDILQRDASLSFLLMRFINNPTINKRAEITSLSHALTYLGEVEVKKFIALLSLASLSQDKPLELIQISLVRAKFCELLHKAFNKPERSTSAFLVGLFSMLDTILSQPIEQVLEKMPLTASIKAALTGEKSEFDGYLPMAQAFESALWGKLLKLSEQHDIRQKELHRIYNEAIVWSNEVNQTLSAHFPRTKL